MTLDDCAIASRLARLRDLVRAGALMADQTDDALAVARAAVELAARERGPFALALLKVAREVNDACRSALDRATGRARLH
jgi:hypothetical protein